MQAVSPPAPVLAPQPEKRDWVAWYEDLAEGERREIRNRLLQASYDEVKADPEMRNFFFFHSEDVVADGPPGSDRLQQLHTILHAMRQATGDDPELPEKRRKAVAFLLAEYQRFLRDNPWSC